MAVTIKFVNSSSFKDEEVWIQFVSGTVAGTGNSGAIQVAESVFGQPNAYSLKQLIKQMNLTGMTARMYVNFGPAPWKILNQGYEPPCNNPNDVNFPIRFDKIEANITGGPCDNIDTTSIDYAGLQSNAKYYNQYSAALNRISDAYGFAYTDRFKYTTMSLAPGVADTLVLEILGD